MHDTVVNADIRNAMKINKIPAWRIADNLNCHENTVYHLLRHQLSPEDEQKFMNAINTVIKERKTNAKG